MVAAVIALAACGGGGGLTRAAYEQKLRDAGHELGVARRQLSQSRTQDEFRRGAEAVEEALGDAADELDEGTPPADVEAVNERLVSALRRLANDWDDVKRAADEGPDAASRAARSVTAGVAARQAEEAIREITRRGYDVGELGSG